MLARECRPNRPCQGTVLSYSAGSANLNPWTYRVVKQAAQDRLLRVLELFPQLIPLLSGETPVVINCYPAAIGAFPSAVFIDTYLRPQNVSRGLLLAHACDAPAVILGQPLPMLHFLIRHRTLELAFPPRLLIVIGGYTCPFSCERAIRQTVEEAGAGCAVLHAYGMAEVDAACLLALRRDEKSRLMYQPAGEQVLAKVINSELFLGIRTGHSHREHLVATGDRAFWMPQGLVIEAPPHRLDPVLFGELESWNADQWRRRTGYARWVQGRWWFQLRPGIAVSTADELMFDQIGDANGSLWLDKPSWDAHPC
ncbi:MAG: hypothetical protein AMXMBFR13_04230 [Phycisphaerae bacterium]